MAPPEPPSPMVWTGSPYVSTTCSLTIDAVSAEITSLHSTWKVLNVDGRRDVARAAAGRATGRSSSWKPWVNDTPQPPPKR